MPDQFRRFSARYPGHLTPKEENSSILADAIVVAVVTLAEVCPT